MPGKIKFFSRVGKTRIIPIGLKMLLIFICLILLSNFITNFISLQLTQRQIINLNNTIMVSQLKELYTTSSNQYQIYSYSGNREESIDAMCKVARTGFDNANSLALGVTNDGEIEFLTDANELAVFPSFDSNALMLLNQNKEKGIEEGSISFSSPYGDYFGVYKYQDDWGYYIIRAELRSDLEKSNYRIYGIISALIIIFTLLFVAAGYITINREFRSLRSFTDDLIEMQKKKKLDLIDISKAPNDDVTYLAASFNSLSMQVSNLLDTFQKFVSKDIVAKAYAGRDVGLEGKQRDLAMLFSDVKSFTYRTETTLLKF